MIGGGDPPGVPTRLRGGAVSVGVFRWSAACSPPNIPRLVMLVILLEDCQFVKPAYAIPTSMYAAHSDASSVSRYRSQPGAAVTRPASGSACFR
jgi:hypothetical protein